MHHSETTFIDAQFKDSSPIATVERIKRILADNHIEVEEQWRDTSVPYCYALSARVVGTTFGVNGKGLSKEFALASCYGELMERLQIGYIYTANIQKDGSSTFEHNQGQKQSVKQILEDNGSWYQLLADQLQRYTGVTMSPDQILTQFADEDGNLDVVPYYCITRKKPVTFPNVLKSRIYTSNGCAAGNTPEEAIVQAISEIVERNHMIKINDGGISIPDIPEEVLEQYTTAYQIITYIRRQGYRVVVKDCSLGTKFPVVCVYIIDLATGRYHAHFGAYPIFEIALERSLTESFQGKNIRNIAKYENFLHKKPGEFSFASISNEIIQGTYEKTPSFFIGEPAYPFNASVGFAGRDNKSLFRECIEFFREQGYDILVRDRSCLGFCTYQVIIPGYSEAFIHRLCLNMDERRYTNQAIKVLCNPSASDISDRLGYLMHDDLMSKYTSNIAKVHGFVAQSKLAATAPQTLDNFLLYATKAYVYYDLGKLGQAVTCIGRMIPLSEGTETEHLICLKRYLTMKLQGYSEEETLQLLHYMHNEATVEAILGQLQRKENPLERYTLHCDLIHCDSCRLQPHCRQKRVLELAKMLREKSRSLDFSLFCQEMEQLVE